MRRRRRTERAEESSSSLALVPVPKITTIDSAKRGGVPLGKLLETARRRVALSEQAAADRLNIAAHELFAFESGMRNPSDSILDHMCEMYGTSRDRMASDTGMAVDDPLNPSTVWIGWAPIELDDVPNRDRLARIAITYRKLRSLPEEAPLTIRDEELPVLCCVIDVDRPDLIHDLRDLLLQSDKDAHELFARMRYHVTTTKELPKPKIELGPVN